MASAGLEQPPGRHVEQRGRAAHQPREQRRVVRRHRRHDPVAAVPGTRVPVGHGRHAARITAQPAEPERRAVHRRPQRERHPAAEQPGRDAAGQVGRQPPRGEADDDHAGDEHHDRDHRDPQPERVAPTDRGRREGHRQADEPGDQRRQRRVQLPETPADAAGTVPSGFRVAGERLVLSGNFLHDSLRGRAKQPPGRRWRGYPFRGGRRTASTRSPGRLVNMVKASGLNWAGVKVIAE